LDNKLFTQNELRTKANFYLAIASLLFQLCSEIKLKETRESAPSSFFLLQIPFNFGAPTCSAVQSDWKKSQNVFLARGALANFSPRQSIKAFK
jgi:hypothetical protein